MAEAGCIGILTTNGSPAMAPWGGTEKTVGANPWSVATPGRQQPRRRPRHRQHRRRPRQDLRGRRSAASRSPTPGPSTRTASPTTDPHVAVHGLLAPMGGHKGYGISFVMDVLSGVLTGSGYATDVAGPYVPDQRSRCGHLVLALRIDAFLPRRRVRRAHRRPDRHHQGRARAPPGSRRSSTRARSRPGPRPQARVAGVQPARPDGRRSPRRSASPAACRFDDHAC